MEYYNYDELYHHGTKGMKWGVRRYQNADGSLTDAGRKRYGSLTDAVGAVKAARIKAKRKKQLAKARKAAAEKKAAAEQREKDIASGKIKARDMTSEELQKHIDKLNLEKRYKQLQNETDPANKLVNEGSSFVKKFWNEAVQPAMVTAGKDILTNYIKDSVKKQLGDKVDTEVDALTKELGKLDLKRKISDAKKTIYENDKKMNGEDDGGKTPSMDDRIKIKNNPDITSEAEKEKYKKQGWYNVDNSKESKDSSDNSTKNAESESSSSESSSTNSSKSETANDIPIVDVPVNSERFKANEQVGIRTYNELKDKYGSHIMYMSDSNVDELYHRGLKG